VSKFAMLDILSSFKMEDTGNKHFPGLGDKPDDKWEEPHCNITKYVCAYLSLN
jgi:hypothetical protein